MSAQAATVEARPPSLLETMAVEVPEGVSGAVKVERFEVPANSIEGMRLDFSGRGCRPGVYTRLLRNGTLWMSDTSAERQDHLGAAWAMRERGGRVLIGGLGLGMIARVALLATPVERVDILEMDPDVIALVGPHVEELAASVGKIVTIEQADVFAWKPPKGAHWTVAYFDVWADLCTDNLPAMATLGRRFSKRRADVCLCWGRERLRAEQRSQRGQGFWL